MKNILLTASILSLTLVITSCTLGEKPTAQNGTNSSNSTLNTSGTGTSTPASTKEVASEGDTVLVDYVGKFPDGKIFDSSIESEAKKSDNYSVGRDYSPFKVTLGEGLGSITGFWKGIVGMKVGESKTITIQPEDAYGREWIDRGESTVDKKIFDKIIERKVAIEDTKDIIKMDVEKKLLEQEGGSIKVGDVLTNERGVKAKIAKIDNDKVTLEIDNSKNPFSGKKLVKGTKITEEGGNVGTITKVTDKEITLEIDNKANPFYGKKLEVGLVGVYQETQRITIKKIEGTNVTVGIEEKNSHPLANKTLIFDLNLRSIQ